MGTRNLDMAERIAATPVRYPFSFVFAGDSGAWADPTADAIFASSWRQTAGLDPRPCSSPTWATSPARARRIGTRTTSASSTGCRFPTSA